MFETRSLVGSALCLSMLLLLAAALPGQVSAQPAGAVRDTSGVFGFLRPTYSTTYNINRQATQWLQNFSFKNQVKGITVENQTNYTVATDPGTKLRARGGETYTALNFTAMRLVPFSVDLRYSRNGTENLNNSTDQASINTGVRATYTHRFFPGTNANLAAGIGLVSVKTTGEDATGPSGNKEFGLSRDLSLNGVYGGPLPGMSMKLNSTFNNVRTDPEILYEPEAKSDPRTNTRSLVNLTWNWQPVRNVIADAGYTNTQSSQTYIITSSDINKKGKEELAEDDSYNWTTSMSYRPPGNLTDFRAELRGTSRNSERRVEQERATKGNSYTFHTRLKHTLFRNILVTNIESTRDIASQYLIGTDTTHIHLADLSVETPWSQSFSTKVIGEMRLRSQRYDGSGTQDFDSLKRRIEATAFYRLWSKISANLSGRYLAEDGIYVHESQSRSTRYEETFGANAGFTYSFSTRTQLIQRYDFTTLFTSFQFDSALSTIQRTRNINTTLNTDLSRKLILSLGHDYLFQETGGYSRGEDGTRYFSRGSIRYRQALRTLLTYKPGDWINFSTEERLQRTDDVKVATDDRTTSAILYLTQRAGFKRPIPGGGNFSCDVILELQKPVRPTVAGVQKYFTARLSLDKSF